MDLIVSHWLKVFYLGCPDEIECQYTELVRKN